MKLHVLVNPRNPTGLMYRVDPFAVHGYKYIKHLAQYYDIVHYGIKGAEVDCEHIDLDCEPGDVTMFNELAAKEIRARSEEGDIIACFYGSDNRGACDANPHCKAVEPSIGYRTSGVFAPYRVFTSYANMHYFYGERGMLMNPSWFDAVIGNPFTVDEFDFRYDKEDYFLYFGRVIEEKGLHLAIQATEKLGKKLVVAGPGSLQHLGYTTIPKHVEVFGVANAEQRRKLMSKAKCLLGLTYYLEPFGNMVIEAALSGTPVITTDWGAFPEIVLEGKTGGRVKDFNSLLTTMSKIDEIDPNDCREWGLNFSDEKIHFKHHQYLQKVIKSNFYA